MVPVMAAADSWWLFDGTMTDGDWSLIGGGVLTACFFVLGLEIIRMAGPVFFSTNGYIGPLAGMGWAALLFRRGAEPLDRPSPSRCSSPASSWSTAALRR